MRKRYLVAVLIFYSFWNFSCLSVANINRFDRSNSNIKFDSLSQINSVDNRIWNWKGCNEFYFETDSVEKEKILRSIITGLEENNYQIETVNPEGCTILSFRRMTANEWNSVAGVYFKIGRIIKIYVRVKITQDITGGWRENRAKKISLSIQKNINSN